MRQKPTKRSKIELYASVVEVIKRYPEGARITKMSYGCGIPVDRLKLILQSLISYGLVQTMRDEEEEGVYYVLTPRAFDFLDTFWKMKGFLEVFGGNISQEFRL